jgi:hypothetical protein
VRAAFRRYFAAIVLGFGKGIQKNLTIVGAICHMAVLGKEDVN